MGKKEIERLQHIQDSQHPDIGKISKRQEATKKVLQEKVISELIPLLLKEKITTKEFQHGQSIIHIIKEETKNNLSMHQKKEGILLKNNLEYDPVTRTFISSPAYSNYSTFFNQDKQDLDKDSTGSLQKHLYNAVLKTLTKGKISKKTNSRLMKRIQHTHNEGNADESVIEKEDYYVNNYVGTTLEDIQTLLTISHDAHTLEKEEKEVLLEEFQAISNGWRTYLHNQNTIAHYQNKTETKETIETFTEYLTTNKVTTKNGKMGKRRPMTFDDIKKKFLPFGASYFSDELRLDILGNNTTTISKRIQRYNQKIITQTEQQEVQLIKKQLQEIFKQEQEKKDAPERYLPLFAHGLTKNCLTRIEKQYSMSLGKDPSTVAKSFGWLEHIIQNKKICATYIEAWAKDDRITLNNITQRFPICITFPTGDKKRYISTPLLKQVRQLEAEKNEIIKGSIPLQPNYTYSGKKEGAINGTKIRQQKLIDMSAEIFPQGKYTGEEYRVFWKKLSSEEQSERPKNIEHLLHLFQVNAGYYRPDLLQALITGDVSKANDIIMTVDKALKIKSERPHHIKTLLTLCHLLENSPDHAYYMEVSDLQISHYDNTLDHIHGLSSWTNNNSGALKKFGVKAWRKSPQSVWRNVIGKMIPDYSSETLYHALFAKKKEFLRLGFFTEENIPNILQPDGQKFVRKPIATTT